MKTKIYILISMLIWMNLEIIAQNNFGSLKVLIAEKETPNETLPFANVVLYVGKTQVAVGITDIDGYVFFKQLAPGKYSMKSFYAGYEIEETDNIVITSTQTKNITALLGNKTVILCGVTVTGYADPLIDVCCICGGTVERSCYYSCCSCSCFTSTTYGIIENENSEKSLKYYPNPTNGKITLVANDEIEELSLVDDSGRLRGQYAITKSETIEQDLSGNPNGLYILQYQSKGKLYREKILLIKN